jgi:hypothetical protein
VADQSADNRHPLVVQQGSINAGIVTLAMSQLAALWPRVDWENPAARAAVKQLYGGIISQYGQSSAAVASLFYDEMRDAADVNGSFVATPADPIPQSVIDKIVDSAWLGTNPAVTSTPAQPTEPAPTEPAPSSSAPAAAAQDVAEHVHPESDNLTTSDLPLEERVPARLDGQASRLVLQPGRETIAENAAKDPAGTRYVRVPESPNPCAFCVMMASREIAQLSGGRTRDATYTSYQSAKFRSSDGEKYHDHCRCEPVPIFPGQGAGDVSPNFGDFQDMYYKSAANAGTHRDPKAILAAMRQLYNVK